MHGYTRVDRSTKTYTNCVWTQERCTIDSERRRESKNSMLSGQLNIYIYIYILSSTDRFVSFYQNSSLWLDRLDSRSWGRNPVDSNEILPLSHEETSASKGNLNAYVSQLFLFIYIRLTATESSIHMKSIA